MTTCACVLKKKRFKVTKLFNKTVRLIHQMWDKMVTMIVIKKDNIMHTIFEVAQTNVESSSMIKAPKKQNKEVTMEEKQKKTINNLVMKNIPRAPMTRKANMYMSS
jgi:hypothetical protein